MLRQLRQCSCSPGAQELGREMATGSDRLSTGSFEQKTHQQGSPGDTVYRGQPPGERISREGR